MCQQVMLLAKNDRGQRIYVCNHGTVHLEHQSMLIRLSHSAFLQFAADTFMVDVYPVAGRWAVYRTAHWVEIWVGGGGFRMTEDDFDAFADLVRAAALRLQRDQEGIHNLYAKDPVDSHEADCRFSPN